MLSYRIPFRDSIPRLDHKSIMPHTDFMYEMAVLDVATLGGLLGCWLPTEVDTALQGKNTISCYSSPYDPTLEEPIATRSGNVTANNTTISKTYNIEVTNK